MKPLNPNGSCSAMPFVNKSKCNLTYFSKIFYNSGTFQAGVFSLVAFSNAAIGSLSGRPYVFRRWVENVGAKAMADAATASATNNGKMSDPSAIRRTLLINVYTWCICIEIFILCSLSVLYLFHLQFHRMRFKSVSYKRFFFLAICFLSVGEQLTNREKGWDGTGSSIQFLFHRIICVWCHKIQPYCFPFLFHRHRLCSSQSHCLPCAHSLSLAFVVLATFTMLFWLCSVGKYGTVWTSNYISSKKSKKTQAKKCHGLSESHVLQAEYSNATQFHLIFWHSKYAGAFIDLVV